MQPVGDLVLPCNTFRMLVFSDIQVVNCKCFTNAVMDLSFEKRNHFIIMES